MIFYKIITIFMASMILTLSTGAQESVRKIDKVIVHCPLEKCVEIENKFIDFVGLEANQELIRERMRFKLFDRSLINLTYDVYEEDGQIVLAIQSEMKKVIGRVTLTQNADADLSGILSHSLLREGEFYDDTKARQTRDNLDKFLADRGFLDPEIIIEPNFLRNRIDIKIDIRLNNVVRIKDVKIVTTNPKLVGRVQSKFDDFRGTILDRLKFRLTVDQLSRELFDSGFYDSEVTVLPDELLRDSNEVILRVQVKYGSLYSFNFRGNHYLSRPELLTIINDHIKKTTSRNTQDDFTQLIDQAYEKIGLYGNEASLRVVRGINKFDLEYVNFFFNIREGRKIAVREILFRGGQEETRKHLEKVYHDNGTTLARLGFLDKTYIKSFPNILKRHYLSLGLVQNDISEPNIVIHDSGDATVVYRVSERHPVILGAININIDDEELKANILDKLNNKVGRAIDITQIENDLNTMIRVVQSAGYFFSEIENIEADDLIHYNPALTHGEINVRFDSLKKTYLNSVIITGQSKTKFDVIKREIYLNDGDLIIPSDIERIRDRIIALDLFSSVRVTPFVVDDSDDLENFRVNLLVQLQEKEFGVAEIAPGYRTDLGFKFSSGLRYNNLYGMNRSATLKAEVNRRFNYSDFDSRRRAEKRQMIEYLARASFTEPYLFPDFLKTQIQLDFAAAIQRKRFVSFDADIFRISPQISKQFFERLTLSLKYQFETINQFDATNPELNDSFAIGSLTPSLTLDLRDDAVRPTKGTLFNINWEFANPYFLSMDNDDITINYYRLTARNSFYFPINKFFTLAFSLSGGVQRNFARDVKTDENGNPVILNDGRVATRGYIPSTKVFRLDGIDTVRGFSAEEINKLVDGRNVGDVVVNDVAYFANFKFEPRYYIDDSFVLGAFFDAGRIYVNKFEFGKLRISSGVTFKVLTPVGTLDFDYGVKLDREQEGDFKEKFGRFHLSIGFF